MKTLTAYFRTHENFVKISRNLRILFNIYHITFINQKIQSLEMPRLVSDFMTVQHIFMFWYVGVDGLDDSLRQT